MLTARDRIAPINHKFRELRKKIEQFVQDGKQSETLSTPESGELEYGYSEAKVRRASSIVDSMISIERDYRNGVDSLKRKMAILDKRSARARRCLSTSPVVDNGEYRRVEKMEQHIEKIMRTLKGTEKSDLVQINEQELEFTIALEARNKERRELLAHEEHEQSSMLRESRFTKLEESSSDLRFILSSTNETSSNAKCVKTQIERLIAELEARKARYKQSLEALKTVESNTTEKRRVVQSEYEVKKTTFTELKKKLGSLDSMYSESTELTELIAKRRRELADLARSRSQLERQNYTSARDKHINSRAVKRLRELERQHKDTTGSYTARLTVLSNRRAELEELERSVVAEEAEVAKYEKSTELIEERLTKYGIKFTDHLQKSQAELEAIDFLAAKRPNSFGKINLADEINAILCEQSDDE